MQLNNYLEAKIFKPDYDKCDKKSKDGKSVLANGVIEECHGICPHSKKDMIVYCRRNNKPCPAWKGYKHGMK